MVTVREALKRVGDGHSSGKGMIDKPAYELIAENLYLLANTPDQRVRGSMRRATAAQKIILDRLVGTRRPGTNPAAQKDVQINFRDLTAGIEPPKETE